MKRKWISEELNLKLNESINYLIKYIVDEFVKFENQFTTELEKYLFDFFFKSINKTRRIEEVWFIENFLSNLQIEGNKSGNSEYLKKIINVDLL